MALRSFILRLSTGAGSLWHMALAAVGGRWLAARRRAAIEDVLKVVLTSDESGQPATLSSIAGALGRSEKATLRLIVQIERAGLVQSREGGFVLTDPGRQLATHVLRAHRLMERYLVDEAHMSAGRVHSIANRAEHHFDDERLSALDEHLGRPRFDPHGDVIPRDGEAEAPPDQCALTDWPLHHVAQVVHVEDEPADAMNRLLEARLAPGSRLVIESRDDETLVFRSEHGRQSLSPAVAANVHVRAADPIESPAEASVRLSQLPMARSATIIALADECRGLTRRRLLDLGITPQTTITAELANTGGSATAYRIRSTLIALRKEQADQILVRPDRVDARAEGGRR